MYDDHCVPVRDNIIAATGNSGTLTRTHNKLAVEIGCNCTQTHTHIPTHKSACSAKIECNCTHTYNVYIAQQQLARGRDAVNGSGFYIEFQLLGSIIFFS